MIMLISDNADNAANADFIRQPLMFLKRAARTSVTPFWEVTPFFNHFLRR